MSEALADAAQNPLETAGVLICGVARVDGSIRLVGRELHFLAEDSYQERRPDGMSIPSEAYVELLRQAEELNACAVFFHTHPSTVSEPIPSRWDDIVDRELAEVFRVRTGVDVYASLVVSPADLLFSFTGRGWATDGTFEIDRILVSGDRVALLSSYRRNETVDVAPLFDRQVRAFGGVIQTVIGQLRVAIVGCGGTGSALAEQLVRLGLRYILLVDDDDVEETNVTRLFGATLEDVGVPKVDVLAKHLKQIAPECAIRVVHDLATDEKAARTIVDSDIVFGCTDDNAGRLVLCRLAAYYLTPYFDCGVLISSSNHRIESILGRVTVQTPGAACLVCRGRIDIGRAMAEQLPAGERSRLQAEGYVPELADAQPAVVSFTSAVASQAVNELLERLSGFGPTPVPTEVLIRFHDRELSTNSKAPLDGHFCDPKTGVLGSGDVEPFLGQLWRAS